MKIRVQNLGVLKDGEVNLDRPLTVFTGPNNYGKTYMSNVIYGIYSQRFFSIRKEYFEEYVTTLIVRQNVEIDLDYFFSKFSQQIGAQFSLAIEDNLSSIFALSKDLFQATKIEISLGPINEDFYIYAPSISSFPFIKMLSVRPHSTKKKTLVVEIKFISEEEAGKYLGRYEKGKSLLTMVKDSTRNLLEGILISTLFRPCNFIVSERKGIELLGKDFLTLQQNTLLSSRFKENFASYPLAIKDSLTATIHRAPTNLKFFAKIAGEIENALLGGKIELDENNNVSFIVENQKPLVLHGASSTVKSLTSFILALKYELSENDLLLIDEPEMNLHPRGQRILARYLAKLANAGLRLVVSTHSNYIIREFNNLIMLGSVPPNGQNGKAENEQNLAEDATEQKEFLNKYGLEKEMALRPEQVRAYAFGNGTIQEIPIDENGWEVTKIDEEIDILLNETDDLHYLLYEEEA